MKGKRKVIILSLLAILGVYLFVLFLRTSDDPEYCGSCHFMKPYYENWLSSTHNQVNCITCHYGPGLGNYLKGKVRLLSEIARYYLGAYSYEITSKVDNESCIKCHEEKKFVDEEIFFVDRKVKFSHVKHLDESKIGFKLQCQTCHSELVQGRHEAVSTKICILCHFPSGEIAETHPVSGCGSCHGPPKDDIMIWGIPFNHSEYIKNRIECGTCHLHVVVGRGDVRLEKCASCHINVTSMTLKSREMHQVHVSKERINCLKCHEEIKHGKVEVFEVFSPVCQECHGNRHSIQEKIYSGTGGRDVPVLPDPMFLAGVSCRGCHEVKLTKTHSEVIFELPEFDPNSCSNCHGKGYDKLAGQWQKIVKERLTKIESEIEVERLLKRVNLKKFNDEKVNVNLETIKRDGSYGVHNIKYVNLLLDIVEKEIGARGKKPELEFVYKNNSRCLDCHFGIENLNSTYKTRDFPHGVHLFKLNCVNCHVGGEPRQASHGQVLEVASDCNKCHHRDLIYKGGGSESKCETCHSKQSNFYNGKFLTDSEDFMAQAGVSCQDCHMAGDNLPIRPGVEICGSCHEQEYTEDFIKKREQIKSLISKWDKLKPEIVRRLNSSGDVEEILKFYELDKAIDDFISEGSFGAHNLQFIDELSQRIEKFIRKF